MICKRLPIVGRMVDQDSTKTFVIGVTRIIQIDIDQKIEDPAKLLHLPPHEYHVSPLTLVDSKRLTTPYGKVI